MLVRKNDGRIFLLKSQKDLEVLLMNASEESFGVSETVKYKMMYHTIEKVWQLANNLGLPKYRNGNSDMIAETHQKNICSFIRDKSKCGVMEVTFPHSSEIVISFWSEERPTKIFRMPFDYLDLIDTLGDAMLGVKEETQKNITGYMLEKGAEVKNIPDLCGVLRNEGLAELKTPCSVEFTKRRIRHTIREHFPDVENFGFSETKGMEGIIILYKGWNVDKLCKRLNYPFKYEELMDALRLSDKKDHTIINTIAGLISVETGEDWSKADHQDQVEKLNDVRNGIISRYPAVRQIRFRRKDHAGIQFPMFVEFHDTRIGEKTFEAPFSYEEFLKAIDITWEEEKENISGEYIVENFRDLYNKCMHWDGNANEGEYKEENENIYTSELNLAVIKKFKNVKEISWHNEDSDDNIIVRFKNGNYMTFTYPFKYDDFMSVILVNNKEKKDDPS